jgi:hypothetical protein
MFTWLMDFNLNGTGEEIERYLVTMIREWPARYQKVDGVLGVMFLGNAWGLAGKYTFRLVLDLKSPQTLRAIDDMYRADAAAKRALNEFRTNRRDLHCRLLKQEGGEGAFTDHIARAAQPHFVYSFAAPANVGHDALRKAGAAARGGASVTYSPVVDAASSHRVEAWHSIPDIGGVEALGAAATQIGAAGTQLFSSFRVADGALIAAA